MEGFQPLQAQPHQLRLDDARELAALMLDPAALLASEVASISIDRDVRQRTAGPGAAAAAAGRQADPPTPAATQSPTPTPTQSPTPAPTPAPKPTGLLNAALLEQLLLLAGSPDVDAELSRSFTSLLCRIVDGVTTGDAQRDAGEGATLKRFLLAASAHLARALNHNHSSVSPSLADVCALRMAAVALASEESHDELRLYLPEYDARRLHTVAVSDSDLHTYTANDRCKWQSSNDVVAESFHERLSLGLELLSAMADSDVASLTTFLRLSAPALQSSLLLAAVPPLLDGQRLQAALRIGDATFGDFSTLSRDHSELALRARDSEMESRRVACSIGTFVALSSAGLDALDSSQRDAASAALAALKADAVAAARRAPTKAIGARLTELFATWLAGAAGDPAKFACIGAALTARALRPTNPQFKGRASLVGAAWRACDLADQPLNFHVGVSVAWAGLVVSAIDGRMQGAFKLRTDASGDVAAFLSLLPPLRASFDRTAPLAADHGALESASAQKVVRAAGCAQSGGSRCINRFDVHRREGKLWASLQLLSVRDSFERALRALPGSGDWPGIGFADGSKGLQLAHTVALAGSATQRLPCCRGPTDECALLERCDGEGSALLAGVDRPWRDLCGGAVAGSLLFHVGQGAFLDTARFVVKSLKGFKFYSLDAIPAFTYYLGKRAALALDVEDALKVGSHRLARPPPERAVAHATKVFYTFRCLVDAFAGSVANSRLLWGTLVTRFAPDAPRAAPSPAANPCQAAANVCRAFASPLLAKRVRDAVAEFGFEVESDDDEGERDSPAPSPAAPLDGEREELGYLSSDWMDAE